jgi:hypothetical protein
MRNTRFVGRITCAVVLAVGVVDSSSAEPDTARSPARDLVNAGTTDRPGGTDGAAFELSAGTDTSKASIRLARTISSGTFQALSLTASAPLNKNDDKTTLATLDGFVNAFKLEGRYAQIISTGRRNPVDDPIYSEICDTAEANYKLANPAAKPDEFLCDSSGVKTNAGNRYAQFQSLFWAPDDWTHYWGISARAWRSRRTSITHGRPVFTTDLFRRT